MTVSFINIFHHKMVCVLISGHTIVFFDIKNMGVDTNILSLAMKEAEIWAKYDFDGGHFENEVIQKVHPNLWAHHCIL